MHKDKILGHLSNASSFASQALANLESGRPNVGQAKASLKIVSNEIDHAVKQLTSHSHSRSRSHSRSLSRGGSRKRTHRKRRAHRKRTRRHHRK
jgi:hypothetical protein